MADLGAVAAKLARECKGIDAATLRQWDEAGLTGAHHSDDPLADKYAERIREASRHISDERVRVFKAFFRDLENVKIALAASDDPEIVGAVAASLDEQERA